MKVEAEIKKSYKLQVYNQSTCMGCYYPEDDWDIVIFGETLEELRKKAAYAFINRGISVSLAYLTEISALHYDGHVFELDSQLELSTEDTWAFIDSIHQSSLYIDLKLEREEAAKKALEGKKEEEKRKSREIRLKMYKNLKKEFEGEL